jgi:hypothetical protein
VPARIRHLPAATGRWLKAHRWPVAGAIVVLAAIGVAVYFAATDDDGSSSTQTAKTPAPEVVEREVPAPDQEADELGFPAFATKNTTRVSGADPIADAAAAALAVYPSSGDAPGPNAVTLVDAGDWPAGIAAGSLVAAPIGAPVLITDGGEVPELTASALAQLRPKGAAATAGRQAFVIGTAAAPDGLQTLAIAGKGGPAAVAAEIDKLRERLAGKPDHVLVASSDDPAYAMPAAAWAARSGDPVLFAGRERVPKETVAALRRHDGVPVFVLGPERAIGPKAMKEIERVAPNAVRVGEEGPVENAIAFARYSSGTFGWNINDPGHGLVLANTERPLDAAGAAALSASGTWGPLLVTDDADRLPDALDGYLLDLKPGYADDPTRAVYNHVWLIGDPSALSVDMQADVDELAEVAPVTSGTGEPSLGPAPGTPESQPNAPGRNSDQNR